MKGTWPAPRFAIWCAARGDELLGQALGPRDQFPLLVKFIDAHQDLSVQVHPDDEKGRRLANDNGKTETWVILDAEPGSLIYAGLKPGVGRDEFAAAISRGQVEHLLHSLRAQARRLHPDRGRHRARDRRRRLAGRDPGDVRRHFPDLRLGTHRAPTASPASFISERRWNRSISIAARSSRSRPVTANRSAAATRERLAQSQYFALERLTLVQPRLVGDSERFTIVMGLKGTLDCRARRETPSGSNSVRHCCSRPRSGPCKISPRGEATVLTCVVP